MLQNRPPIVVILGHVDHGKTTLLDFIRKSNVAVGEAGGITQHIRSFQISLSTSPLALCTFIDTPGHAAFSAMRARGSRIADIAVLVVAADDGVMPQTRQSIEYIKSSGTPFIVALNKSDLPSSNPDRVKAQLSEAGVVVEDYGGTIPSIAVSAKTGAGVSELLELIHLLYSLDPAQADLVSPLEAVVLESRLDAQKGPLATVIVKNGSLRVGQSFPQGKIRALTDSDGRSVKEALPSQPVEIMGLSSAPEVGSVISSSSQTKIPSPRLGEGRRGEVSKEVGLNLIIKSDVAGSLEAIVSSLPPSVRVISSGTGDVAEGDVLLAQTSSTQIIAFNVKVPPSVAKLAEIDKVAIHSFKIIYELLDKIDKLAHPRQTEITLGQAEIKAQFKIDSDRIAGCKCISGEIAKNSSVRLVRDNQPLAETKIKSLRLGKSTVEKVKSGQEFGAVFFPAVDFRVDDSIIAYTISYGSS